jgi:hypothetical protein
MISTECLLLLHHYQVKKSCQKLTAFSQLGLLIFPIEIGDGVRVLRCQNCYPSSQAVWSWASLPASYCQCLGLWTF